VGQWLGSVFRNGDEKTKRLVDRLDEFINGQNEAIIDSTWLLLSDVRYELEIVHSKLDSQMEQQYLQTLCTDAYTEVQKTFHSKLDGLMPDSGLWIQRELAYKKWINHEQRDLLITGGPGMGKTFLAAAIVGNLKKIAERDHISVAFFFVQGNNKSLQDMVDILKSVAFDIQGSHDGFRRHILQKLDGGFDVSYSAKELWKGLFEDFWKRDLSHGRLMVVIDGLDETGNDQQEILRNVIATYRSGENEAIQFAILGRPTIHDTLMLQGDCDIVFFCATKANAATESYVKNQMIKWNICSLATSAEFEPCRRKVVEEVMGNFESARLFTISKRGKGTAEILASLEDLHSSLDKFIQESLDTIIEDDPQQRDKLRTILTWPSYSQRPLSLGEVYEIMQMQYPVHLILMIPSTLLIMPRSPKCFMSHHRPVSLRAHVGTSLENECTSI